MHKTVFSGHNLEMHIKAHAGKRLTNADIEEIVTNISLRNVVREQKRDYVGKIPKRRTPPTHPPSLGIFTFFYRFCKTCYAIL